MEEPTPSDAGMESPLDVLLAEAALAPEASTEGRVLAGLRRITHAIGVYSKRLSAGFDVTTPQLVTLHCIVRRGPITPSEISRHIHLSKSTIVGILDRLEEKGLAARTRGVRDRRQVFVESTPKGRELVARAPSPLHSALSDAMRTMPESEQLAIAEFLERIAAIMEAQAE